MFDVTNYLRGKHGDAGDSSSGSGGGFDATAYLSKIQIPTKNSQVDTPMNPQPIEMRVSLLQPDEPVPVQTQTVAQSQPVRQKAVEPQKTDYGIMGTLENVQKGIMEIPKTIIDETVGQIAKRNMATISSVFVNGSLDLLERGFGSVLKATTGIKPTYELYGKTAGQAMEEVMKKSYEQTVPKPKTIIGEISGQVGEILPYVALSIAMQALAPGAGMVATKPTPLTTSDRVVNFLKQAAAHSAKSAGIFGGSAFLSTMGGLEERGKNALPAAGIGALFGLAGTTIGTATKVMFPNSPIYRLIFDAAGGGGVFAGITALDPESTPQQIVGSFFAGALLDVAMFGKGALQEHNNLKNYKKIMLEVGKIDDANVQRSRDLLGVTSDTTDSEIIKQAFRKKTMEMHRSDSYQEGKMKPEQEAYLKQIITARDYLLDEKRLSLTQKKALGTGETYHYVEMVVRNHLENAGKAIEGTVIKFADLIKQGAEKISSKKPTPQTERAVETIVKSYEQESPQARTQTNIPEVIPQLKPGRQSIDTQESVPFNASTLRTDVDTLRSQVEAGNSELVDQYQAQAEKLQQYQDMMANPVVNESDGEKTVQISTVGFPDNKWQFSLDVKTPDVNVSSGYVGLYPSEKEAVTAAKNTVMQQLAGASADTVKFINDSVFGAGITPPPTTPPPAQKPSQVQEPTKTTVDVKEPKESTPEKKLGKATQELTQKKKEATQEPSSPVETKKEHIAKIMKNIESVAAKRGVSITDVTPKGYGPEPVDAEIFDPKQKLFELAQESRDLMDFTKRVSKLASNDRGIDRYIDAYAKELMKDNPEADYPLAIAKIWDKDKKRDDIKLKGYKTDQEIEDEKNFTPEQIEAAQELASRLKNRSIEEPPKKERIIAEKSTKKIGIKKTSKTIDIKKAFQIAKRSINKKTNLPILRDVKFKDGKMFLTDLESAYMLKVDNAPENGVYALTASGFEKTKESMDEFPADTNRTEDDVPVITIDSNILSDAVVHVKKMASVNGVRPTINGIFMHGIKGGDLVLFSTDSYKATQQTIRGPLKENVHMVVPFQKSSGEFIKMLGDTVTIYVNPKKRISQFIEGSNGLFAQIQIEGEYPAYQQIMPKWTSRFEIPRKEIMEELMKIPKKFSEADGGLWILKDSLHIEYPKKSLDGKEILDEEGNVKMYEADIKISIENKDTGRAGVAYDGSVIMPIDWKIRGGTTKKDTYAVLNPSYVRDIIESYPEGETVHFSLLDEKHPLHISTKNEFTGPSNVQGPEIIRNQALSERIPRGSNRKEWVTLHHTREDNLIRSIKMGGLISPSLAVVRIGESQSEYLDQFGDVVLLGGENFANDITYYGDAYSTRMPTLLYKISKESKDRILNEIKPFLEKFDEHKWSVLKNGLEHNAIRGTDQIALAATSMNAGMAMYLKKVHGIVIDPVMKSWRDFYKKEIYSGSIGRMLRPLNHSDTALSMIERRDTEFIKKYDIQDGENYFGPDTTEYKNAKSFIADIIRDLEIEAGDLPESREYTSEQVKNWLLDKDGKIIGPRYSDMIQKMYKMTLESATVDKYESEKVLRDAIEELDYSLDIMREWYEKRYESNLVHPYFRDSKNVSRNWTTPNLENYMFGRVRGKEGFFYGMSALRSKILESSRGVNAIRLNRDRIGVTKEDRIKWEELTQEYSYLMNILSSATNGQTWDMVAKVLSTVGQNITKKRVSSILHGMTTKDIRTSFVGRVTKFLKDLQNARVPYAEIKPQRTVNVGEFKAAVVPDGTSWELIKLLEELGIKVYKYDQSQDVDDVIKAVSQATDIAYQMSTESDKGLSMVTPEEATNIVNNLTQALKDDPVSLSFADELRGDNGEVLLGKVIMGVIRTNPRIILSTELGGIREDTAIHEVGHIYLKELPFDQRKDVLDEIKKKYKVEDDVEADEILQDKFYDFVKNGKEPPEGVIRSFIRKFVNFIKELIASLRGQYTVKQFMNDILAKNGYERPPTIEELKMAREMSEISMKKEPTASEIERFQKYKEENPTVDDEIGPIEYPEILRLARDLRVQVAVRKMRGSLRGLFDADENKISLSINNYTNVDEAARTLAHEIGHLVDYLPDNTLTRGNLLGRLQTLRAFTANTFGIFETTNKELRNELWKLSKVMRPIIEETASKSHMAYRKSGKEIYADFISALFVRPSMVRSMAPKAWDMWFSTIDKKPQVKDTYFRTQNLLRGDPAELIAQRIEDVRKMFETEDQLAENLQAEMELKRKYNFNDVLNDLLYSFQSTTRKAESIQRGLEKEGYQFSDETNPLYLLNSKKYIPQYVRAETERAFMNDLNDLKTNEIAKEDAGFIGMSDRIMYGDRSQIANPLGMQPEFLAVAYGDDLDLIPQMTDSEGNKTPAYVVNKKYEDLTTSLRNQMGEQKFQKAKEIVASMRKTLKSYMLNEASDMFSEEQLEMIASNEYYMPFEALSHYGSNISAGIRKQVGTHGAIGNPVITTVKKFMSLVSAVEHNKVKKAVVDLATASGEVRDAKMRFVNNHWEAKEPQEQGWELIQIPEKGKIIGKYIPSDLMDAYKQETLGYSKAVARVIKIFSAPNKYLFRPAFIQLNVGFQSFNAVKDFVTGWMRTPDLSMGEHIKRFKEGFLTAKVRGFGIPNGMETDPMYVDAVNTLYEMSKEYALPFTFNDILGGSKDEKDAMELLIKKIQGPKEMKSPIPVLKHLVNFIEYMEKLGNTIEILPKISAWKHLREGDRMPKRLRSEFIRGYAGSPEFAKGGYLTPSSNAMFMFSNAIIQGMKSDWDLLSGRYGKRFKTTRNGKTKSSISKMRWVIASLIVAKLLQYAANKGLFGSDLEDFYTSQTEYDKTNYLIAPLGKQADGKWISARLPLPETARFITGLFWKSLPKDEGQFQNVFADVIKYSTGQLPNIGPGIQLMGDLATFASGGNPYDSFRGRNVLSDQEYKAGGAIALSKLAGYEWSQMGGGILWKPSYDTDPNKSLLQKTLEAPVLSNILGRWIKVGNYGQTEQVSGKIKKLESETATEKLNQLPTINSYVEKYNTESSGKTMKTTIRDRLANKLVEELIGKNKGSDKWKADAASIKTRFRNAIKMTISDETLRSIMYTTNENKIIILKGFPKEKAMEIIKNMKEGELITDPFRKLLYKNGFNL